MIQFAQLMILNAAWGQKYHYFNIYKSYWSGIAHSKSGQQQGLRKQWIIYLKAILNDSLLLNLKCYLSLCHNFPIILTRFEITCRKLTKCCIYN